MAIGTVQVAAPVTISASGVVAGGTAMARTYLGGISAQGTQAEQTALGGAILGFFCNSTNAGTVQFSTNNGGAAGSALTGTITPSAGTFYSLPMASASGIFATIGGSALNITVFVAE